jgi:hypothetical protein
LKENNRLTNDPRLEGYSEGRKKDGGRAPVILAPMESPMENQAGKSTYEHQSS